jgi:hypothetical protein
MPNHCTNLLSCTSGKPLAEVLKPYLTSDGRNIDFNKIVPMPQGIVKSVGFCSVEAITKERAKEEREAQDAQYKLLKEENVKLYGFADWYDWCVANWDTKWNAYSCWTLEEGSGVTINDISDLGFQTAWSPPLKVIRALAKLTGETFRMSYYDEGWMFGGVFTCGPEGEEDVVYGSPSDVPEDSELFEELDCAYFLENQQGEDEE